MKQLTVLVAAAAGLLIFADFSEAQTPQATPTIAPTATPNTYQIAWPGVAGRVYFVQVSTDLQTWLFAPVVEFGTGQNIVWAFSSTGDRTYVRLNYSVATNFTSGANGDFDGDGISNIDEVTYFHTDPTVSDDPDGDGYLNSDELAQGTDPNDASSTPFDPLNPPPADWYVGGFDTYYAKFLIDPAFEATQPSQAVPQNANRLVDYQAQAAAMADGSFDLPFVNIQAGVNAAQAGDVIQVAPGTYAGGINLAARDVKLIGMPGQREATIINGGMIGLDFGAANGSATVVPGFTVRAATTTAIRVQGGGSPIITNCVLDANATGVDVNASSPLLFNTVINGQTSAEAVGNGVVAHRRGDNRSDPLHRRGQPASGR